MSVLLILYVAWYLVAVQQRCKHEEAPLIGQRGWNLAQQGLVAVVLNHYSMEWPKKRVNGNENTLPGTLPQSLELIINQNSVSITGHRHCRNILVSTSQRAVRWVGFSHLPSRSGISRPAGAPSTNNPPVMSNVSNRIPASLQSMTKSLGRAAATSSRKCLLDPVFLNR